MAQIAKNLKKLAERSLGWNYWIGHSADEANIAELIRRLRPEKTSIPLMRIGGTGDGGYLVPDDLDGIEACVSPGVSEEISFDLELASRGIDIYMADASVSGPPIQNNRFYFTPKFLGVVDEGETIRLDTYCRDIGAKGDLLLQMDIEGAEWPVLLDASPETISKFRIIILEFHELQEMFSRFGFNLVRAVFDKLLRSHRVVHIHPNNIRTAVTYGEFETYPLMEFTFYRRDRAPGLGRIGQFPHPEDAHCVPNRPGATLPLCWW